MKKLYKSLAILAAVSFGLLTAGCTDEPFQEITGMELARCLEPLNLSAKVIPSLGDQVTFSWDVAKDAESYILAIFSDPQMTQSVISKDVAPGEVPVTVKLTADKSYYFKVQATSTRKPFSNWAVYDKAVKTFAVKDPLFMKIADRQADALTFTWVADPEVTHIAYKLPGEDDSKAKTYELNAGDISAGSATIKGLAPGTEYVSTLYYLSASRGEVTCWTTPDVSTSTPVSSLDALTNAVKTAGAKILLKMEGSPYETASMDVANGVTIYGEESADGTKPVINGELHIPDNFDGGDLYFEGIEFNGVNGTYGFVIQHKNGCTTDNVPVKSITFKNCVITGYSKGIFYEWGKTMKIGEFTFQSCDIYNVNGDGSGGGDGFDLRNATSVDKLNFIDNTIYNGFRTFIRIDANPVIGKFVFDNNTLMNLCFVDNTNNAGVFGLQTAPGEFSMKNNLFLNMVDKATLASANVKYLKAGDALSVSAKDNWFYNYVDGFFTDNFTLAAAGGKVLSEDPCYNAKGGLFNILSTSEIAGAGIGASKWWTAYTKEPEDLTLNPLPGAHTWDLGNAKYFSGTAKEPMVRDGIMIVASEDKPVTFAEGKINFSGATSFTKKGLPEDGYLCFKVTGPGSLVIKPSGEKMGHVTVAAGPVDGSAITIKGGAAAIAENVAAQKILITDITEETMIYIFASDEISIDKLSWSEDVTQVNTALGTPAPSASPASFTQGEAADIVVSWDPVASAGSYSAVFNGKTFAVSDETDANGRYSYTIEAKTTGMLDPGSYTIQIFANPGGDDIYNTQSSAGVAAFAVLPKAEQGGSDEFIVKDVESLKAAIDAGKPEITLAEGTYDLAGALKVIAPLALKGENGAVVKGAFALEGDKVGSFALKNISFNAKATGSEQGVFITLNADAAADDITVEDCVIDGYSKSVIYGNNETAKIDKVTFRNITVTNQGTGQGVFDFRKGTFGSITIMESTVKGGRDFLRADASVTVSSIIVRNNTLDAVAAGKNGNGGILWVRCAPAVYRVSNNLFLNEDVASTTITKKGGNATQPAFSGNFWYNLADGFSSDWGDDVIKANGGVILSESPVKDAAAGDYTLTSGLAMSSKVGASKWNPSIDRGSTSGLTVKSTDEFKAALEAGKTDIVLEAPEDGTPFATGKIAAVKGLRLTGSGNPVVEGFIDIAGEDLGDIVIDGICFKTTTEGCAINVSAASAANKIIVRNCTFDGFGKSILYDNNGLTVNSFTISNIVMKNHGTGQGVFDIRKGEYVNLAIEQSTITGGRDLIRADAKTITGSFSFNNNTVDGSNLGVNSNGIMYVRATPAAYNFKNNLFINEVAEGKKVLLSKTSGVTGPTAAANNFFYNIDEENFFNSIFSKETTGAVMLSYNPVKDAAAGDYTLTDALCLSSNAGAARWNANAGRITTDFTVSNMEEFITALDAGKTSITMKYGIYDFTAVEGNPAFSGGVLTIDKPLTLKGVKSFGNSPVIIGSIKLNTGVTEFVVEGLVFDGKEKALGNTFEVAGALEATKILVRNCEIKAYNKSLFYGNVEGTVGNATFSRLLVHDMGTGQGMFDCRKKVYGSLIIENSTIYNGGRDFIRCDSGVGESVCVRNNTLSNTGIDAGNGLLWVRVDVGDKYVVENNLFLNETGDSTLLAKSGAKKPVFKNNFFYNLGTKFWGGQFTQEDATANGGAVLTADPCTDSAGGNFKVTNADVKAAGAGDPRWL